MLWDASNLTTQAFSRQSLFTRFKGVRVSAKVGFLSIGTGAQSLTIEKTLGERKTLSMSLSQVLEALPDFTFEERQLLIRRVIELDDLPLSQEEETLVESRLAAHHSDPTTSLPVEELKKRLRSRTNE